MKKIFTTLVLLSCAMTAAAQSYVTSDKSRKFSAGVRYGDAENPEMDAIRIADNTVITLDGNLSESVWSSAPTATKFTQRIPKDGKQASQKTFVKLLYTDTHIYVGVEAHETAPDSILAPLFRRDGGETSDWFFVGFDSYNDKRTAFIFGVNPRGVQKDQIITDNSNEDGSWDAVWEAKASINGESWTAEMKIPLSQLRFDAKTQSQLWGVNFSREISRNGEAVFWAPTSQNDAGIVSSFGRLKGIKDLQEPRRLEVLPYISSDLTRVPSQNTSNPYFARNKVTGNVGGDIKYGLTSDLTLSATFNPDFGQVEADPAVINLTANESFFDEKRPFFLEGRDIFQFGNTKTYSRFGNPITFYSRRIGRAPQGNAGAAGVNAQYTEQSDFTTIAAAAKLSGKTKSGWSIGLLDAYTLKENLLYTNTDGGESTYLAEPATNYLVARTKKDFNSGNTYVGAFGTAVNRNIEDTYLADMLRKSAYLIGTDFEHNFSDRNWVTSAALSYSTVHGSQEAIELAQNSPVRYYDRVDSDALSVDPGKTSLSGFASEISIQKRGGDDNWLTSVTYAEVSPGYETNDIGFMNRSDYRALHGGVIHRETDPKWVQYHENYLFTGQAWNYDGDRINNVYVLGGSLRFKNLWNINYELFHNGTQYMDRTTRGGPIMLRPKDTGFNFNVNTNSNKQVYFHAGTYQRQDVEGEFDNSVWAGVTLKPTTFIQVTLSPEFTYQNDTDQYVTTVEDVNAPMYDRRYVFADIKQRTLMASLRLNWTFSTTMSLQTYIRPFISSGEYSNFKEFKTPGTFDFDIYGRDKGTVSLQDGTYTIDPDGSGASPEFNVSNPDFNFRSVQGNAVFRWEYKPGSALFLVWQQQRSDFAGVGNFEFGRDINQLFRSKPTNVFLVKLSYWFGS